MSQDKNSSEEKRVIFKTPPKIAFVMGILSGVTLASLFAFTLTFSMLKSDNGNTKDTLAAAEEDSGTVAGAEADEPDPTPAPTVADIKIKDSDYIRGDKNAPVTLVEYSDFQCPFCAQVQDTVEQILDDYDGQVRLIYRHFPLSFHENAQKAAEASECAGEQGKFWEMHDIMFANQSDLSVDSLKGFAKDLGLSTSQFNSCLDDGKYTQEVKDEFTEGTTYGVQGTPATFVNGTLVSGAQPYASFKQVIDAAL